MKCYTVNNFILNDQNNTFTFQKSFKKSGIQINDETINTGGYQITEILDSEDIRLKVYVN